MVIKRQCLVLGGKEKQKNVEMVHLRAKCAGVLYKPSIKVQHFILDLKSLNLATRMCKSNTKMESKLCLPESFSEQKKKCLKQKNTRVPTISCIKVQF